ncbi:VCBS repeat-containing protein [Chryseolinea soli]|uniref:RNA-binding protein n=1 Tax=Chryseolinea soli TaxID=2321403 RepID=A0A385SFT3_9BACT|nr:VCBS repeat-containing protein [Chryseolinea soli]AYB29311.1 RNA-binding protein [Chryseolinea soli]
MKRYDAIGGILLLMIVCSCGRKADAVFEMMSSRHTGIHFNNVLEEDEQVNVNNYMNIYTGAGVAAGDINNDGLTDLFFSGNTTSSRLYLNKGDLTFEDITESSGVLNHRWATGAVMADVNNDGWLDIYQCVSGGGPESERGNLLFINNQNKTFTESSRSYGLADKRQAMHASFFDYDGDGDLDVFIITNPASYENMVNHIQPRKLDGTGVSTDVLYRNNGDHTFTDVSKEAGILVEGYSLGLAISDINNDGWPDIYISNDFIGSDILYVNNQDGTFTDRAAEYLRHTSFAGMGNDVADLNNDGLVDIVELDMRPEDNKRLKLIIPPTGYDKYQLSLRLGYLPQFTRNTLQLNRGNNTFSEISFLSGVSSTDWSWSPLLADYDNDGDKDLFATNGFLRDLGNMDYITYQNIYNTPLGTVQAKTDKKLEAIKALKGAALKNYIYSNNGDLTFTNQTQAWGLQEEGFSHGAAYADLDNDGDLDLVVNTMNEEARVYRNHSEALFHRNYLRIKFRGSEKNGEGIGTKVWVFCKGQEQYMENFLNRGYESTMDGVMHVGLDSAEVVDSLKVIWPDGKHETLTQVKVNQLLTLDYAAAKAKTTELLVAKQATLFNEVSRALGIDFVHQENDFIDFKVQPLLPHMHSRNGPGVAVADVNGDGLEDFYVGGASSHAGALFRQGKDRKFKRMAPGVDSLGEELGVLFFDADGDKDDDLYIATGGSEKPKDSPAYKDYLYLNDGKGKFTLAKDALPEHLQSGSSVIASDYDRDGDLDLFVGGRVVPGEYPLPAASYIFRNESKPGECHFTDATQELAPGLLKAGLVTSALWTDVDNDGWVDLLIAGEFMPITCLKNQNGKSFTSFAADAFQHTSGWWNSLVAADFDQDGDMDYIAGNLGLNSRYHGTPQEPLCIYANDYDKNGSIDPVMTYYLQGRKYIVHTRDELISQITAMRHRFVHYAEYAEATFDDSFLKSEIENAYTVCAENFQTSYIENQGNGKFAVKALPMEAQFAPTYGMTTADVDGDGFTDVLMTGNMFSAEVSSGRYDASVGVFLRGDGQGHFKLVNARESGFYADGDAKGAALLQQPSGNTLMIVANNSSRLKAFAIKQDKHYAPRADDAYAIITLKDGRKYKHEFYYGSTYLSQSSRVLLYTGDAEHIEVYNFRGEKR